MVRARLGVIVAAALLLPGMTCIRDRVEDCIDDPLSCVPTPRPTPTAEPSASPSPSATAPRATPHPTPSPSPSPTPTPGAPAGPTPATCPGCLFKAGFGPHGEKFNEWLNPNVRPRTLLTCQRFDSTPRRKGPKCSNPNGCPCNAEHHAVCSATGSDHGDDWRDCEYPKGASWTSTGARKERAEGCRGGGCKKGEGYQFVVCGLPGEFYSVTIALPEQPTDMLGVPQVFCPDAIRRATLAGTF
jgi:hypothetical protein